MPIVGGKNTEMLQEILKFPDLLSKGLEKGKQVSLSNKYQRMHVKLIGMGGSALVGSYLQSYLTRKLPKLSVEVIRSLNFPYNPDALHIIYSYSGQTRETLNGLQTILKEKDARIIVATSNGKLESIAQNKHLSCVKLPRGFESRSHLPFGVAALAYLLGDSFGIKTEVESEIEGAIKTIKSEKKKVLTENIEALRNIAKGLEASFPIVIGDPALSPVLLRFVNQLAENAKHLATSTTLPEAAHNLICPLRRSRIPISLLFLKRSSLGNFTSKLTEEFKNLLQERNAFQLTTEDKKFSMKTLLHPTFLIDLLSVLIAEEKDVSAYDIKEIEEIKEKMKE